jgi:hypothetical protein
MSHLCDWYSGAEKESECNRQAVHHYFTRLNPCNGHIVHYCNIHRLPPHWVELTPGELAAYEVHDS